MKKDKFLIAIVISIIVLMGLAVGVFLVRQNAQDYVVEDTPEGIVHNYVFAIQQDDFERAYDFLIDGEDKPSFSDFRSYYISNNINNYGVQIQGSEIYEEANGDRFAVVDLIIIYSSNDPLSSGNRSPGSVNLLFQEGKWKVENFPYQLWPWDWYLKE